MVVLGLGTLAAVTILILALLGTTDPRTATVTDHSSVGSRAPGLSRTPGPGPATASHSALTKVPLYRGSSIAGHQPGAAPEARDAGVAPASAAGAHATVPTQVSEHKSDGAVP